MQLVDDCVFCKIVRGEIPAEKVYEDEHFLAFLDIQPTNTGHTLVIPKAHFENFILIPDTLIREYAATIQKVARAVIGAVGSTGANIIMNIGTDGGQLVFHAHTHVIPRYKNDGVFKPANHTAYKEGEEKIIGEKIRSALT